MSRVTRTLRVTIPKALAERYGIRPGEEVEWIPDGDGIRLELVGRRKPLDVEARLKLFDDATKRQRRRERRGEASGDRGWTREDLYTRGRGRQR